MFHGLSGQGTPPIAAGFITVQRLPHHVRSPGRRPGFVRVVMSGERLEQNRKARRHQHRGCKDPADQLGGQSNA